MLGIALRHLSTPILTKERVPERLRNSPGVIHQGRSLRSTWCPLSLSPSPGPGTHTLRSFSNIPFMVLMAFWAASWVSKCTKPNPRDPCSLYTTWITGRKDRDTTQWGLQGEKEDKGVTTARERSRMSIKDNYVEAGDGAQTLAFHLAGWRKTET